MNFRHDRGSDAPPTEEERLQERLSAYLDGELTAEERASIEAEVAADDRAREALDDLQMVRMALSTLEIEPAPRSFAITAQPAPARAGLFARFEMAIRASSAVAAVAFVVAVAGGGGLSVATTGNGFAGDAPSTMAAPAAEPDADVAPGAPEADVPDAAPAPTVPEADRPAEPEDGFDAQALDTDDRVEPETPTDEAAPQPDVPPAEADEAPAPAEAEPDAETLRAPEGEALRAPDERAGAQRMAQTDSFGGTSAALGALAVLLAALSGALAWSRRQVR